MQQSDLLPSMLILSPTNYHYDPGKKFKFNLKFKAILRAHLTELFPILTSAQLQLTSTAKVARWFNQLQWNPPVPLSRPESGFVSASESRSEKNLKKSDVDVVDHGDTGRAEKTIYSASCNNNMTNEYADEYLLVEGTASLWSKLSVKKRKKLLGLKLGKVTTF
jgi:hypothetical protein